jgi:NADPH:quinone reductase-like Zn-dependent oxidoreductase
MRRVVVYKPGSYDRLFVEEHPDLAPRAGEVVIECDVIGVNYADCIVRMGLYASARKYVGFPITPGFELSGRVAKLGEGVADLSVGEQVFAVTRFDAYATQVRVPRTNVFRLPRELTLAEAAGFPAVALTAWFALAELCKLRPGMRVLVHSAAGGVGGMLIQIAKLHGCEVVGVVGAAHKRAAASASGADAVIDKSSEPLWRRARELAPDGYDVVLDANGVETLRQSYRHVRSAGRLVIYGFHTMLPKTGGRPSYPKLAFDWLRTPRFNPLEMTNDNKSVLAFNLSYLFERQDLLEEGMQSLLGWLREGKLRPSAITRYDFERVADAHRDIESGQTIGKLVLIVAR